ncbi:EAL and HDOD domain-containing protein [Engelhardtia mirabilis]|uniref:Phytochrome-like protein cph2 n=1 Tax=Engelhardtia mirabilis TaxID=2528011 RepID=A0A518BQV6_9BACT|nr:Phytochrome-like protein cph2 [Planctomycetes bacterium Pla133]QDV03680.1 Phytochrome-like protein cph2 [Planctomycetes bacterium Pla86]
MTKSRPLFVGRQPIFTRRLGVFAYELLFRPTEEALESFVVDEDRATSEVLVGACLELGLDRLVGDRLAFVNLTKRFLTEEGLLPAGPDQIVLEILENVSGDQETIDAVKRLRGEGYRIALDDFTLDAPTNTLLQLADIVKLDLRAMSIEECAPLVEELIDRGIEVLAEKIETIDEFKACKELGFHYFQGYFLERPSIVKGRAMGSTKTQILAVLSELYSPEVDIDRLQRAISVDMGLSYRILRHINTARYGIRRSVESVREAVVFLGLNRVRNLASLVLMASVENKPDELIRTAMLRGRMCEILAQKADRERPDSYFTVGMFSCLDALLDTAMDAVLARLPLSEDVQRALIEGGGDAGDVLSAVVAYEHGMWGKAVPTGFTESAVAEAYAEACEWVDRLSADVED